MNAARSKTRSRPRRAATAAMLIAAVALLAAAFAAPPASASLGINDFDLVFSGADSTPGKPADDPTATQAGSHPFAMTSTFEVKSNEVEPFFFLTDEVLRDLDIETVAGLVGDTSAVPKCSTVDFVTVNPGSGGGGYDECPDDTAIGVNAVNLEFPPPLFYAHLPVFNIEPPPGVAMRIGFNLLSVPVTIDLKVKEEPDFNVIGSLSNAPQTIMVFGATLQLWGTPADPIHDPVRGRCVGEIFTAISFGEPDYAVGSTGDCPSGAPKKPFLTLPGSCAGPVATNYKADSWEKPGVWTEGSVLSHDDAEPPNPQGFTGCGKLGFTPRVESRPTTESAETGTGLDFNVDFADEGLKNPEGLAQSTAKKAEIALPEGVTINPSVGEGLDVCTPADLDRETLGSNPGDGCPNASKVGSLHVEFPIIDQPIDGSIFLAQQDDPATTEPGAENPFDSLIALYFVLRNTDLGVLVKLPVLVEPDPETGQLVVTLDDIPQFPFSHFNAHLREGQRAALVTPATCGTYTTEAKLTPWSDPGNPRTVLSDMQITSGVGGGACPPGGTPPFEPGFEAGSINNNAGSFSPFNMRLIRADGEQDMTKFAAILPPGELGSLAGVDKCPDAAIEAAKAKTAREELASPSCPANSEIGHTLAGAGVGGALTFVGGQIYLAGPYKGDPLSVVSITPALAGPFDAGTVVVRLALNLNPKTAEVEVDGANSDPIPHILKGIVLKVRDLRVYVDRPNFTLNPTSCDESSAKATIFGSYLDVFDPADDVPAALSTRYQAANCLNLGYKPHLSLNLKGGTRRGANPGLRANYKPRKGDANAERLVVRLPRSAFLDQAHIRTICTRVQFAADNCPKAAQYGYIRAWTPLLDEPLQGPVWLRSSNHKLPDLIFDLRGLVDIEVATRLDSIRGGIRAIVNDVPDAPISRVVLRMQGGKKGLIVNSRDLCRGKARANVHTNGQNGKRHAFNPVMRALRCGAKRKAERARHSRSARVAKRSAAG